MEISPVSLNAAVSRMAKVKSAPDVTFRGIDEPPHQAKIINMHSYLNDTAYVLQSQLEQDGFSAKDIKDVQIFNYRLNSDDPLEDKAFQDADSEQIGQRKEPEDIQAMQRVYKSIKEKFHTPDVDKFNDGKKEFIDFCNLVLAKGITHNHFEKQMILGTLAYATAKNEPLIEALLDDETFNNTHLNTALINAQDEKSVDIALQVLKTAQEKGFKKKFSKPLAELISAATPENLEVITKIIQNDQDYLTKNTDFAADNLLVFVRSKTPLTQAYLDGELAIRDIALIMGD